MALLTHVGTFSAATATGNQAITGVGFAPKVIFFWGFGATSNAAPQTSFVLPSYGATTGPSNSYSASMINGSGLAWQKVRASAFVQTSSSSSTLIRDAALASLDGDGFTLNWTTARSDGNYKIINYLALGGSDLTGAKVVPWKTSASTGHQSITGAGFTPDAVLHFHDGVTATGTIPVTLAGTSFGLGAMSKAGDQWAVAQQGTSRDQVTNKAVTMISGTTVAQQCSFVSMDSDGFTISNDVASVAANVISLCLKGPSVKAGLLTKTTGGAPASQSITGAGFTPKSVLLASAQDVVQTTPQAKANLGVGASDGTNGVAYKSYIDSVPSQSAYAKNTKAFIVGDSSASTIDAEADMSSLDSDGFTLNWTTNNAVATSLAYLAFGDAKTGSPQPLAGSSVGTSTATATRLSLRQPLSGTSAGVSAASTTRLRLAQPLAGSAAGTSTASATRLRLSHPLTATSAATSAATASRLTLAHPLTGSSAATSSATASRLTLTHPLTGTSVATSTATATGITLSHPLAGEVDAVSFAAGLRIALDHALAGTSAGTSSATADRIRVGHPLAGIAAGTSQAYGDLTTIVPVTHLVRFAADARPSSFAAPARPSSFVADRPATVFSAGDAS